MNRTLIPIPVVLAAACSLLSAPTYAGPAGPSPAASSVPAPVVVAAVPSTQALLPERTPIPVTLMSDLKLGANKVGEDVSLQVSQNVYSPNHSLLIPVGTPVLGTVTQSAWRNLSGKSGKMDFTCDYVLMPNNIHVPLRSTLLKQSGPNHAAVSVGVISALSASAKLLIDEHDAMIHHGVQFTIYVNQEMSLPVQADNLGTSRGSGFAASVQTAPNEPLPPLPCKATLVMIGGIICKGTIVDFDGTTYKVLTPYGEQEIDASSVQSVSTK